MPLYSLMDVPGQGLIQPSTCVLASLCIHELWSLSGLHQHTSVCKESHEHVAGRNAFVPCNVLSACVEG